MPRFQNRNKLHKGNDKKAWVKTGVFCFIFLLSFMLYATYVFLCYIDENNIGEINIKEIMNMAGSLTSPTFSLPITFDLIKTLFYYQAVHLWYVYACVVLFVFLAATSRIHNEYRGIEKGSATWEEKHTQKEFHDKSGIPLANIFYATVNNPKNKSYKSHNLNEIVIGGSGAGKSFRKIKPDIIQMFGSYVVTDPKGELYRDTSKLLNANGYKVRVLNMINISLTNTYNPFMYMREEQDVLSVADLFMKNTAGESEKEDFWSGSARDLLVAIMVYLWKSKSEIKCFGRVIRLINSISYRDGFINELCELSRCMKKHKIENPNDSATVNWESVKGTPEQTMGGIAKSLSTRLGLWAVEDVDEMTAEDEMDFDNVGIENTAIFLIIPPTRNTYKAIVNIFYSQLFERLMYIANFKFNGRLPKLVSCELDEFANCGKIPNFNETLSVVRSHNIRICIVLQGLSQLKALYKDTWESIIGNCSLFTYLGTNDMDTKEYVVKKLGKTTVRTDTHGYNSSMTGSTNSNNESYDARDLVTVDELPLIMKPKSKSKKYGGNCIIFVDEFRPFYLFKFNTLKHPKINEVGSSFEKDFHNNTDIEAEYGGAVKLKRRERHKTMIEELLAKSEIEATEAAEQEKAAEEAEQNQLAEAFAEDMDEFDDAPVVVTENIEEEFNTEFSNDSSAFF
jgi:type IV secretion system protein VirD4